jgi:hypothetical protein
MERPVLCELSNQQVADVGELRSSGGSFSHLGRSAGLVGSL